MPQKMMARFGRAHRGAPRSRSVSGSMPQISDIASGVKSARCCLELLEALRNLRLDVLLVVELLLDDDMHASR